MDSNELTDGTPRVVVNVIGAPLMHKDGSRCYGVDVRPGVVECLSTGFQIPAEDARDWSGEPIWQSKLVTLPRGL